MFVAQAMKAKAGRHDLRTKARGIGNDGGTFVVFICSTCQRIDVALFPQDDPMLNDEYPTWDEYCDACGGAVGLMPGKPGVLSKISKGEEAGR